MGHGLGLRRLHGRFAPMSDASWITGYELVTADEDGSAAFYAILLPGWQLEPPADPPAPRGIYVANRKVGALIPLVGQLAPARWIVSVAVPDLEAAIRAAREAGSSLDVPPIEEPGLGRYAVVRDREGAMLKLTQPMRWMPPEGQQVLPMGAPSWAELLSDDLDEAGPRVAGAFGWQTQAFDLGEDVGRYLFFMRDGAQAAGANPRPDGIEQPGWLTYFEVERTEPSVEKACEGGAEVLVPLRRVIFDGNCVGAGAILRDPQGAVFGLYDRLPRD